MSENVTNTDANTDEEQTPHAEMVTDTTESLEPVRDSPQEDTEVTFESWADENEDPVVVHETSPLLQPTIALMGTVVLAAVVLIGILWNDPELVGGIEFAELIVNGIAILAGVILLRLGITLMILWRTTYVIHEDGFCMEYELAFHRKSREIPVEQLRGREHERGRFETIFDCATIRLLTGGTDRSLGFIEFKQIPDAETVGEKILAVRRKYEHRNG